MKIFILFFSLVFSYSIALADTDQIKQLPAPERTFELPDAEKQKEAQEQIVQTISEFRKAGKLRATIQDLEAIVTKVASEVCEEEEIVMCQALIKTELLTNAYNVVTEFLLIRTTQFASLLYRTVLLKESKKAQSVLQYYKEVYNQDWGDILIGLTKPNQTGGSSVIHKGGEYVYLPDEITIQIKNEIDISGIPGLKEKAPQKVELTYTVHFNGVLELKNQVQKLFFGSTEIIFIDDALYEAGGLNLELALAHELSHHQGVKKDSRQAFKLYQEKLRLMQQVQKEPLAKKDFQSLSYHKHFINYIGQAIAEFQKVQNQKL